MSERNFLDGLRLMDRQVRGAVALGMDQSAKQCLDKAINGDPAIPHKEGILQGSGGAYVGGQIVARGNGPQEHAAPEESGLRVQGDMIVGEVAFNSPYAAYQHEGHRQDGSRPVRHYSEEGVGPKFLEIAMKQHAEGYFAIIADEVRKVLG